jgi:hypothetical protein
LLLTILTLAITAPSSSPVRVNICENLLNLPHLRALTGKGSNPEKDLFDAFKKQFGIILEINSDFICLFKKNICTFAEILMPKCCYRQQMKNVFGTNTTSFFRKIQIYSRRKSN